MAFFAHKKRDLISIQSLFYFIWAVLFLSTILFHFSRVRALKVIVMYMGTVLFFVIIQGNKYRHVYNNYDRYKGIEI